MAATRRAALSTAGRMVWRLNGDDLIEDPTRALASRFGLRSDVERGDVHHISIKPRHESGPFGAGEQHLGAVRRDRGKAVEAVVIGEPHRLAAFEIAEENLPVRWI